VSRSEQSLGHDVLHQSVVDLLPLVLDPTDFLMDRS
jgi:hypothetical protein